MRPRGALNNCKTHHHLEFNLGNVTYERGEHIRGMRHIGMVPLTYPGRPEFFLNKPLEALGMVLWKAKEGPGDKYSIATYSRCGAGASGQLGLGRCNKFGRAPTPTPMPSTPPLQACLSLAVPFVCPHDVPDL